MRRTRATVKIYQSRLHLILTMLIVAVPFFYLLAFSFFAQISVTKLFFDIVASVIRLFVAYFIALIFAWTTAVSFYRGKTARFALPIFDVLQSFPTFAALPLAVYMWGPSNFTVIFFLFLTVVWPIFFSIVSSLRLIKHDWFEAVEMSRLSGFSYLRLFLLPASFSGVITGSIIGLGEGWEALVATEIIVNIRGGLGSFFATFSRSPEVTALGIFGLLLLIFSINKIVWIPLLDLSHKRLEE